MGGRGLLATVIGRYPSSDGTAKLGGIMRHNRKCRDVGFLVVFFAFWVAMIVNSCFGFSKGNPLSGSSLKLGRWPFWLPRIPLSTLSDLAYVAFLVKMIHNSGEVHTHFIVKFTSYGSTCLLPRFSPGGTILPIAPGIVSRHASYLGPGWLKH